MKINDSKTKTAVFNTARSKDFYPRMKNVNDSMFENVEEFKLLSVEFVPHPISGVKWDKYVMKLVKNAYSNMWILRRLKEMGVGVDDLLLTYQSRVRIHLELNVPLWHFRLHDKQKTFQDHRERSEILFVYHTGSSFNT